jgi:hypothetical protein
MNRLKRNNTLRAATIVLGAVAILAASVERQAAAGVLAIKRWTVDVGGGGYSRSGLWTFAGTVGQHDAGLLPGAPYSIRGGFWGSGPLTVTSVETPDPSEPTPIAAPRVARIFPIAPNPTGSMARFAFELPESRPVVIRIYRVSGALVRTLTSHTLPAGRHEVTWDARDANGSEVGAGLYFVRVQLGHLERSQKLLIVR